jgi:GT2 family glycosyltransferase
MKVIAVVVTYNRIQFLPRCIEGLLNQVTKIDEIIVVNNNSNDGTREWLDTHNNSNDGTREWLDTQQNLVVIHQENLGASGGYKRGMEEAFKNGADWIWVMDDDVAPHSDCLGNLLMHKQLAELGILVPCRYAGEKPFLTESKKINLTNPFKALSQQRLRPDDLINTPVIDIQTMTFEGPLIKREVVEKIGLPDPSYFILYDDADYACRAILAGFKIYMISSAHMNRVLSLDAITFGWKNLYDIYNNVVFDKKYGKNVFVKYFRSVNKLRMYLFSYMKNIWWNNRFKKSDIFLMFNAFIKAHRNSPRDFRNRN